MNETLGPLTAHPPNVRASVEALCDDMRALVRMHDGGGVMLCDRLVSSPLGPAPIVVGDEVLVIIGDTDRHGVILGRIASSPAADDQGGDPPDTLVLEATKSLTLRVGDGSITIREDGKILIKGKDLVSNAQRMNRIKGGAVSIN